MGLSWNQETEPSEAIVYPRQLSVSRWDRREAKAADATADELRHDLDRDRARRDLQRLIDGR